MLTGQQWKLTQDSLFADGYDGFDLDTPDLLLWLVAVHELDFGHKYIIFIKFIKAEPHRWRWVNIALIPRNSTE